MRMKVARPVAERETRGDSQIGPSSRSRSGTLQNNQAEAAARNELAVSVSQSPYVTAQRQKLQGMFGRALQGDVVQRAVDTAGGKWYTQKYEALGPKKPDMFSPLGIGAEISLSFAPGKGSPYGAKIGLIQTVTALANGKADPTGDEAVPLNKEGRAIDRGKGDKGSRTTSPVYGAHNDKSSTAKSLTDNLPSNTENSYGERRRFSKNIPAKLWDMPSSDVGTGVISKSFETTAVVLEGKHKGTYLGSVGWGYRREAEAREPVLNPTALTKISDGNPTEEFVGAAREWNSADTNDGEKLVHVPIPNG